MPTTSEMLQFLAREKQRYEEERRHLLARLQAEGVPNPPAMMRIEEHAPFLYGLLEGMRRIGSAYEATRIPAFIQRAAETAGQTAFMTPLPERATTGSPVGDTAADIAGQIGAMLGLVAASEGLVGSVAGALGRIPALARVAESVPAAARLAARGAATGAAMTGLQAAAAPPQTRPGVRELAQNAAFLAGANLGGALARQAIAALRPGLGYAQIGSRVLFPWEAPIAGAAAGLAGTAAAYPLGTHTDLLREAGTNAATMALMDTLFGALRAYPPQAELLQSFRKAGEALQRARHAVAERSPLRRRAAEVDFWAAVNEAYHNARKVDATLPSRMPEEVRARFGTLFEQATATTEPRSVTPERPTTQPAPAIGAPRPQPTPPQPQPEPQVAQPTARPQAPSTAGVTPPPAPEAQPLRAEQPQAPSAPASVATQAVMPRVGGLYTARILKTGQEFTGTVERIYKAKTGAVLAVLKLDDGSTRTIPVSKHAEWRPAPEPKAPAAPEPTPEQPAAPAQVSPVPAQTSAPPSEPPPATLPPAAEPGPAQSSSAHPRSPEETEAILREAFRRAQLLPTLTTTHDLYQQVKDRMSLDEFKQALWERITAGADKTGWWMQPHDHPASLTPEQLRTAIDTGDRTPGWRYLYFVHFNPPARAAEAPAQAAAPSGPAPTPPARAAEEQPPAQERPAAPPTERPTVARIASAGRMRVSTPFAIEGLGGQFVVTETGYLYPWADGNLTGSPLAQFRDGRWWTYHDRNKPLEQVPLGRAIPQLDAALLEVRPDLAPRVAPQPTEPERPSSATEAPPEAPGEQTGKQAPPPSQRTTQPVQSAQPSPVEPSPSPAAGATSPRLTISYGSTVVGTAPGPSAQPAQAPAGATGEVPTASSAQAGEKLSAAGQGVSVEVLENPERNGVEVRFSQKPSGEILQILHRAGFRWSPRQGLWYAKRSERTLEAAREVQRRLGVQQQTAPPSEPAPTAAPQHPEPAPVQPPPSASQASTAPGPQATQAATPSPKTLTPTRGHTARRKAEDWFARVIGPRRVGGRYRSGYSGKEYEVLDIQRGPGPLDWSITVRWLDDETVATHSTPWDYKRDQVIYQPPEETAQPAETRTPEQPVDQAGPRPQAPRATMEAGQATQAAPEEATGGAGSEARGGQGHRGVRPQEAGAAAGERLGDLGHAPLGGAQAPNVQGTEGEGATEGGRREGGAEHGGRVGGPHREEGNGPVPSGGAGTGNVGAPSERGGRSAPGRETGSPELVRPRNLRITAELAADLEPKGSKDKFRRNVRAIRLLKQLEAEGRPATPEEQAVLARYSGWGSLPQVFDRYNADWAKEREELQQLLTKDEWEAARHSTLNAHYSSPAEIRAMWDGVLRMGFKGGRVLEPSAGVGHFLGFTPDPIVGETRFTAVELDSISGRITKLLYPNADVRVMGFEQLNVPDDFYDLAISNVPFGDYPVVDRRYDRSGMNRSIHNYFFAKALDKVRPGGVVMFITSHFTMDAADPSARQYIANRADLLLALRLPRSAQEGAGTAVTTDILVLRKRAHGQPPGGEPWLETAWQQFPEYRSARINEYFMRHPEFVLGNPTMGRGLYSSSEYMVEPDGRDLEGAIRGAFEALPPDALAKPKHASTEDVPPTVLMQAPSDMKPGAYALADGKLVRHDPATGRLVESDASGKVRERLTEFVGLKTALLDYYRAQLEDRPDQDIEAARRQYEKTYDAFVKKWGPLHGAGNQRHLRGDPDYYTVLATEEWNPKTERASKGPAFRERTLQPPKFPDKADSSLDALAIVLAKSGRVDMDEIASMVGKTVEDVAADLDGIVFRDPDGGWQHRDEYLSGNVRDKLRRAEVEAANDPRFRVNVEALRAVQPEWVPFDKISLNFHSPVVPEHVMAEFISHVTGVPQSDLDLTFSPLAGQWVLDTKRRVHRWEYRSPFSTDRMHALEIVENLLLGRKPTVRTRDPETNRSVIDKEATALARERADAIVAEFWRWLKEDRTEYRQEIERRYNEEINVYRKPTFDGSHMTFPGMNPAIKLRKYQRDVVWRIVRTGNTLIAHPVGAGKTFELAAAAMELKRLGIVRKPMLVEPNHLVDQVARDFRRLYPGANVLVIRADDVKGPKLAHAVARIAAGNWDAVIIRQSSFTKIPPSIEVQRQFYGELLDEVESFLADMAEERAKTRGKAVDSRLVKRLEKVRDSLKKRMDELEQRAQQRKDLVSFEDTGVDALFVDEAHAYKNLFYYSMLRNVKGLGSSKGSGRAFDMLMKVRYLQRINGGRGIVFATGTPITNSLVELYTLFRFLRPDLLGETKQAALDPWLALYGRVTPQLEAKPDGSYGVSERLTEVLNPVEVVTRFHQFADVLPPEAIEAEKPRLKGGRRQTVVAQASDALRAYIQSLAERLEAIRTGAVDPHDDNYLKVNNHARLAAIDLRLVVPNAADDPQSKLNLAVENIYGIWKRTEADRLAQVVFLDVGVPKGQGRGKRAAKAETPEEDAEAAMEGISDEEAERSAETAEEKAIRSRLYEDIRQKLAARGVPEREIAFIHDATTDAQKLALFDAVNEGQIRIILGSTGKMGVGTNMHKRLVALHHIDTPWRPADLEQREGRILRPGNENKEVEIYTYVTKGTFDEYLWQLIESKAAMVWKLLKGEVSDSSMADPFSDAMVADASVARALASGKPEVMEHVRVTGRLAQLRAARKAWQEEVHNAGRWVETLRIQLDTLRNRLEDTKEDAANRVDTTGDRFRATILGTTYTERKAAQQALEKAVSENSKLGTSTAIGEIGGFELYFDAGVDETWRRNSGLHAVQLRRRTTITVQPSIASIEHALRTLPDKVQEIQDAITEKEESLSFYQTKAAQTKFDGDDEIRELEMRKQELEEILGGVPDHSGTATVEAADSEPDADSDATLGMPDVPAYEEVPRTAPAQVRAATPVTRAAIIQAIADRFGVPVRTGRMTLKGARGEYKERPQVIRTKRPEDIRAVAHELGHHLAHVMGLQPSRYPDLEELGAALYPDASSDKQRAEGLAEFVALFVMDANQAREKAPVFAKDWELALQANPSIAEALTEAQRLWAQYHAQDPVDRVKAQIVSDMPGPRPWLSTGEKLYADWVEDLHPIYAAMRELVGPDQVRSEWDVDILRNPYVLARLARGRFRRAEAWLTGQPMTLDGKPIGPSLKEILDPVRDRIDDFEAYLVAERALELNARGINSGIDTETAEAAVQELETPAFQRAAEQLYRLQDALIDLLVDAGMLSAETAKTIRDLNHYYVPFYRLIGEEASTKAGASLGKRWADLPQPVKKIRGSSRSVLSPLVSVMRNIIYIHDVAARNMAARALAEWAGQAEGLGWLIEKLPVPVEPKSVKLDDLRDALMEAGVPEEALDAADLERIATTFQPVRFARWKEKKENVLVIWRSGKPEFYQVHPELYRALEAMDNPPTHWLIQMLSPLTRVLRAGATLNPEFALRNPVRDTYEAWVLRRYGFTPFVDTIRGLAHVLKRDELYWQWVNSGGAQSTFVSVERDYLHQEFRRLLGRLTAGEKAVQIIRSPITFMETISQGWEEATRVGAFERALQAEGRSRKGLLKAGYWSREVTLDFNRAGAKGRQYNAIKAFFNASVQGADRVVRAFKADPRGMTWRALLYITIPTLALYLMNRKDPRYEELPRWRKDLYWVIPVGNGLIYIPKPPTLGVLFGTIPERFVEWVDKQDPKAFDELYRTLTTSVLPGDPTSPFDWLPDALLPWVEVATGVGGWDSFTDRPIVPRGEQDLSPEAQYGPQTSETAKAIGRALGQSPRKVEHLIYGYGGGMARHVLNFLDMLAGRAAEKRTAPELVPGVQAFTGRAYVSAASLDRFYEELDKLEQAYRTKREEIRRSGGNPDAARALMGRDYARLTYMRRVRDRLAQLRDRQRQILAAPGPAGPKRQAADQINRMMVNEARRALGMPAIQQ